MSGFNLQIEVVFRKLVLDEPPECVVEIPLEVANDPKALA